MNGPYQNKPTYNTSSPYNIVQPNVNLFQSNPPKHHHYILLHIILIAAIILTFIYFGYNKGSGSNDAVADKNSDAFSSEIPAFSSEIPPPFPTEILTGSQQQNKAGENEQLRADSRSDAPPPLPLLP